MRKAVLLDFYGTIVNESYALLDHIADEFKACVVYNNELTTMLVQDLTYLGQCPITNFDKK